MTRAVKDILGVVGVLAFLLLAIILMGPGAVMLSYPLSVFGSVLVALWMFHLSVRSKKHGFAYIMWLQLHICVWSFAFGLEEAGWWMWQFDVTPVWFQHVASPFLKIVQGSMLAGLSVLQWLWYTMATRDRMSYTLKRTWVASIFIAMAVMAAQYILL